MDVVVVGVGDGEVLRLADNGYNNGELRVIVLDNAARFFIDALE